MKWEWFENRIIREVFSFKKNGSNQKPKHKKIKGWAWLESQW